MRNLLVTVVFHTQEKMIVCFLSVLPYIALRKTFNVVSYRLLFDFLLLEMTDGCSEFGYIKAFNRKRRMFVGGEECAKKVQD